MELVLTATVQLINRQAESKGLNGKLNRACKSIIALRQVGDDRTQIVVSTAKDPQNVYYINKISLIRSKFIHEGKLTIEISEPQVNILIRDSCQEQLQKFLNKIEESKKMILPSATVDTESSSSSSSSASVSSRLSEPIIQSKSKKSAASEIPGPSSSAGGAKPRPRSKTKNIFTEMKASTSHRFRRSDPTPTVSSKTSDDSSSSSDDDQKPKQDQSEPEQEEESYRPLIIPIGKPRFIDCMPDLSNVVLNREKLMKQARLNFPVLSDKAKENANQRLASLAGARRNSLEISSKKRSLSPEISKREINSLLQKLKRSKTDTNLKIVSRAKYPQSGFSSTLRSLTVNEIQLRKIDNNILALKNLNILDLSNNRLSNVDPLKNIQSPITILKLSGNRIEKMDEDFFLPFRELKVLELNNNLFSMLPYSIVYLPKLYTLTVANNFLLVLPYNMHYLRNLMEFKTDKNQLGFIPFPLTQMSLRKADVSQNPLQIEPTSSHATGWGTTKGVPSLLELAGEVILNRNHDISLYHLDSYFNHDTNKMPKHLKCYLFRGKRCAECSRLSLRYHYKVTRHCVLRLADEVTTGCNPNGLGMSVKYAICNACHVQPL